MVPRAGMIKRPVAEGRFALHASIRIAPIDDGLVADKRGRQGQDCAGRRLWRPRERRKYHPVWKPSWKRIFPVCGHREWHRCYFHHGLV